MTPNVEWIQGLFRWVLRSSAQAGILVLAILAILALARQRQMKGGDLYLKEMAFLPSGKCAQPWWTWTKGRIIHRGDKTASAYIIKEMDGAQYMFFEWKSGDYTIRHMKPKYYVLKKAGR